MLKVWTKVEKISIIVLVCVLFITILFGYLKVTNKAEPYVSTMKETTALNQEGLHLKNEVFTIKTYGYLDRDAEAYFEGDASEIKKIKVDVSKVNTTKPGVYKVTAKNNKKSFSFKIKVVKSDNPSISVNYDDFKYILSEHATMAEIKEIIGASAKDVDGKDLTSEITGWPDTLPNQEGTGRILLKVSDDAGRIGYREIIIHFTF